MMKLLASISRTTLECFHRDVYRPRLALVLLVLLSIVAQQEHTRNAVRKSSYLHASSAASEQNQGSIVRFGQGGLWSRLLGPSPQHARPGVARQIDTILARLPDRLRLDKKTIAIRWVKTDTNKHNTERQSDKDVEAIAAARALVAKGKKKHGGSRYRNKSPSQPHRERHDARGGALSAQRKTTTTRNVLRDLLNADALSVLIALHVLWIVRFSSMLLDDMLDKELFSASPRSWILSTNVCVILWLVVSIGLSCISIAYSWAEPLQRWGIAQRADEGSVSWSIDAIKFLELSATLSSLVSPLCRLRTSDMAPLVQRKVSLPSPSHSPALVDYLPISRGLANILSGRDMPTAHSTTRTRHRMAAHWSAPSLHGRRMIAAPARAPPIPAATATQTEPQMRTMEPRPNIAMTQRPAVGLAEPLRLPTIGKAPRVRGMRVNVDTSWLVENGVVLYGHLVGALQYIVILFTLPSFAPTSFPSLLSAISARSELCAVSATWSAGRRSVECLEFVRRRWAASGSVKATTSAAAERSYAPVCSICFETVEGHDNDKKSKDESHRHYDEDCCLLDCGHHLHAICLVQWLTKQTFCPCCHATLKATPPQLSSSSSHTAVDSTSSANVTTVVP